MNDCNGRPDVVSLVEKRLNEIVGEDLMPFLKQAMRDSRAVLTGSFVLQCILGEKWNDSDIDFFIPQGALRAPTGTQTSEMDNWLYAEGKQMERAVVTSRLPEGLYEDIFTGGTKRIQVIRDYWLKGTKFQLVHTDMPDPETLRDWVVEEFDFSVVRNAVWLDSKNKWQWHVSDWNAIETRSFQFSATKNVIGSLKRREKYEERGFDIRYCDSESFLRIYSSRYFAPLLVYVNFRNQRPLQIKGRHLEKVDPERQTYFNSHLPIGDDSDASLIRCKKLDRCDFEYLSCWHLHGLSDGGYEVVYVDRQVFDIVRTADILFALQTLRLPTLVLCLILKHVAKCNSFFCKPTRLWNIVAKIRHLKERI